ncbi:MAG TPA: TonB-dependent receptor [Candidatus Eisenbacteria bacterium]|nr:TonB-dependent receptor [Candidatus Eisenbacteria bacterium]
MPRAISLGWMAAALLVAGAVHPVHLLAATDPVVVEGRILDDVTGEPLSDVAMSAGAAVAATDREGRFRLSVADDSTTIVAHRIGYRDVSFRARLAPADWRLPRAPVVMTSMEVAGSAVSPRNISEPTLLAYESASREAIGVQAAPSLAEAIESTEGLSSSRPGSWGAKTFVRGLGGERVAVMVDGNRLYRACNVGMDGGLATINPDNVERVEILAGPGSTLYGSGNLGGVVNVVTRGPRPGEPFQGELHAAASSAVPGGRLGGTLTGQHRRLSVSLAADGASYGDQRSPSGTIEGSSYRDLTLDANASYRLDASRRLDARAERYAGRDIGYPGAGNAFIPEEDRSLYSVDYGWQRGGGLLDGATAKLFLQSVDHHMTMSMVRPPTMPGGSPMTSTTDATSATDTWGARAQARLKAGDAIRVDMGAEATRWDADGTRWVEKSAMGTTTTTLFQTWPGVSVTDAGAFLQSAASIASWLDASGGARIDGVVRDADGYDQTRETIVSGNAGLRARHPNGAYARAGIGWGYRVPDPTELYGVLLRPDGYLYVGNPDLETETSRSVEASVGWSRKTFQASATAFENRLEGYIAASPTGTTVSGVPVRQYGNIANARIRGLSGSASADAARWLGLRATVSYTWGENRTTGAPLPQIAPVEGSAAARVTPAGGWPWMEAEAEAAAAQDRPATAQGEIATPGFVVWNLRAGASVGSMELTGGVENLFDDAYRRHLDPSTIERPGRNLFLRIVRRW